MNNKEILDLSFTFTLSRMVCDFRAKRINSATSNFNGNKRKKSMDCKDFFDTNETNLSIVLEKRFVVSDFKKFNFRFQISDVFASAFEI
jgi:hypothetical protein